MGRTWQSGPGNGLSQQKNSVHSEMELPTSFARGAWGDQRQPHGPSVSGRGPKGLLQRESQVVRNGIPQERMKADPSLRVRLKNEKQSDLAKRWSLIE